MTSLNRILSHVPYQQVIGSSSDGTAPAERFDIYCLGLFCGPSPSLLSPNSFKSQTPTEIVELVILEPHTTYRPHYHKKSVAIIYIIQGDGVFLCGDRVEPYHKGQRFSIPETVKHGFQTNTETLFLSIQTPPILDRDTGQLDLYYA